MAWFKEAQTREKRAVGRADYGQTAPSRRLWNSTLPSVKNEKRIRSQVKEYWSRLSPQFWRELVWDARVSSARTDCSEDTGGKS